MNIHPLFVHFPIGLLVVYSLLELGGYLLPALRRQVWVFPVKVFLLFGGVLAAFAALVTGGLAKELIETAGADPNLVIVEVHSSFAVATTLLYLLIAVAYLIRIADTRWGNCDADPNGFFMRLWGFKKWLAHLILDTPLLPALALLALVGMTVTGALGAAIVYGPDIDPFVSFIYHLFVAP